MKAKKSKIIVVLIIFISLSLLLLIFTPKRMSNVIKHNSLINEKHPLSIEKKDSFGGQYVVLSETKEEDKLNNLYNYFSGIKVRRVLYISDQSYRQKYQPRYIFSGFINFYIIGDKYLIFNNNRKYVIPSGFDIEEILAILA